MHTDLHMLEMCFGFVLYKAIYSQFHWLITSWSYQNSEQIFAYYKTNRYILETETFLESRAHTCPSQLSKAYKSHLVASDSVKYVKHILSYYDM